MLIWVAVFVYSCPGYNCGIKERMLYASCKSPLLDTLEQDFGFVFDKKVVNILNDVI
jgi:twinfilin-like protein